MLRSDGKSNANDALIATANSPLSVSVCDAEPVEGFLAAFVDAVNKRMFEIKQVTHCSCEFIERADAVTVCC